MISLETGILPRTEDWNTGAMQEKNKNWLQGCIRNKLFPSEVYPERLFPDLGDVVVQEFHAQLRANIEWRDVYQQATEEEEVHALAIELVSLRSLLTSNPAAVVLLYRNLIYRFVASRANSTQDSEEITQEIISRLLSTRIKGIHSNFKWESASKTTFTSYMMMVVRNLYHDWMRENARHQVVRIDTEMIENLDDRSGSEPLHGGFVVERECERLKKALVLFNREQPKLELFLRLKYRLVVDRDSVRAYQPRCRSRDARVLMSNYQSEPDNIVFGKLVKIVNRYEFSNIRADSLRKWLQVRIQNLIELLNAAHGSEIYNNDNLEHLVRVFYQDSNSG